MDTGTPHTHTYTHNSDNSVFKIFTYDILKLLTNGSTDYESLH